MQLRIFTEPQQGATYEELLAVATATEEAGFDAFFRSDHLRHMGSGSPGPGSSEAWLTLGALGRETSRIRLGTLLTAATFRPPGLLAIMVAEADAMSGGRVELGLGAGWYELEHSAYGIAFPSVAERFDRLEEQLAIVTGLWETAPGDTFSFEGSHYRLTDSPALPKPAQSPRPPLIVGGTGRRRTPRLAARFADEFNIPFASAAECDRCFGLADQACEEAGRDPGTLVRSVALTLCCGEDEAEYRKRADAIGRDPTTLRAEGAAGTPTEVAARLGEYGALGVSRIYLQVLDLADLDHLRLVAEEVAPRL